MTDVQMFTKLRERRMIHWAWQVKLSSRSKSFLSLPVLGWQKQMWKVDESLSCFSWQKSQAATALWVLAHSVIVTLMIWRFPMFKQILLSLKRGRSCASINQHYCSRWCVWPQQSTIASLTVAFNPLPPSVVIKQVRISGTPSVPIRRSSLHA